MIISHRHRFIFIKTRKTAGSSLEIALSRVCGPDDIITPLDEAAAGEETLRARHGGVPPQVPVLPWYAHLKPKNARRFLRTGQRVPALSPHSAARDVRAWVGSATWDRYFKFAVERNPWDRIVSAFHWRNYWRRTEGNKEFDDLSQFIAHMERRKPWRLSNWWIYTIGDEIAVDRVLRFEHLTEELGRLCEAGWLPPDLELPKLRLKGATRPGEQNPAQLLSWADRRLIERHCAREIAAFGYRMAGKVRSDHGELDEPNSSASM